jgi:4-diphosphocytidyl-2-C-methyl-D-erythritol kinase
MKKIPLKNNIKLFSPAKINLFFKVLSKRKDGYHEIASLYQAINLGDIFQIRLSNEDKFTCEGLALNFDDSNLIYNALQAYRKAVDKSFCVEIALKKNIPVQAGLGGGSSNAATTLFGLNKLLGDLLPLDELITIGKKISSDVCFFFSSGSAFCTGRGEIFDEIPYKNISLYLAFPSFGVSTPKVYQNLNLNLLKTTDYKRVLDLFEKGDYLQLFNDLETAAFTIEPRLSLIKRRLEAMGFDKVVMTGSGSCFLCFGTRFKIEREDIRFYKIENIQRNSNSWYPYFLSK